MLGLAMLCHVARERTAKQQTERNNRGRDMPCRARAQPSNQLSCCLESKVQLGLHCLAQRCRHALSCQDLATDALGHL